MTYTIMADVYLGDVSSQVFEFILKPRPCLFLNAKNLIRTNELEFPQWDFGEVITDVNDFSLKIDSVIEKHHKYIDSQKQFIKNIFGLESLSGKRGAQAIINKFSLVV